MTFDGMVVSRQDLDQSLDSSRVSSPDAEDRQRFNELYSARFDNVTQIDLIGGPSITHSPNGAVDDDVVEFRLFSGPSDTTVKVKLDDDPSNQRQAGFVNAARSNAYYFQTVSTNLKTQLNACVVTGEQVEAMAAIPWPGCRLPWRVIHLDQQGSKPVSLLTHHATAKDFVVVRRKARPGKKVRIARRKVRASKEAATTQAKAEAEEKDAALRDKKTRRNREKKLKKKEKEKAKKAVLDSDLVNTSASTLLP